MINPARFAQNPALFMPTYGQLQEHHLVSPPLAKRHNLCGAGPNYQVPFSEPGQELLRRQQQQNQLQMQKVVNNELASEQQQQLLFDQLYQLAELIETGNNPVRAQGILARLNHQLSPIVCHHHHPISLIFKIGAYKSFSEVSPVLQFANFTCNQALLEALDGFDSIHIIDFDIGFGGQWSSLMQELALRQGGGPALKSLHLHPIHTR
ncbi:scarecrow-like protein 6 [Quercus suber]|uniref:Scarecrow-like protein 6 n=1 Tax=Quercus suber TaxID=58331 RepID=A0AAW0L854_QUESU